MMARLVGCNHRVHEWPPRPGVVSSARRKSTRPGADGRTKERALPKMDFIGIVFVPSSRLVSWSSLVRLYSIRPERMTKAKAPRTRSKTCRATTRPRPLSGRRTVSHADQPIRSRPTGEVEDKTFVRMPRRARPHPSRQPGRPRRAARRSSRVLERPEGP